MQDSRYYLRNRGRVTGPFDLEQIRRLYRLGQVARFAQVSADGRTWSDAVALPEVFRPAGAPPPVPTGSSPPPVARWFFSQGDREVGPLHDDAMRERIAGGEIGPETLVWTTGMAAWVPCAQANGFVFAPAPSAVRPPTSASRSMIPQLPDSRPRAPVTLVGILAVACTGLLALCLWFALRGTKVNATSSIPGQPLPINQTATPQQAPPKPHGPSNTPPTPAVSPPQPLPTKVRPGVPQPRVPDPAAPAGEPEVPEVRLMSVRLPTASSHASGHDGNVHSFDRIALPPSNRYTLQLQGLGDDELKDSFLVDGPGEPGQEDTLVVSREPLKDGNPARTVGAERRELARFWVEHGRLKFRWDAPLPDLLVGPSRALRDCILEVHADHQKTLKLLLREPLVDPRPLTVAEGRRPIDWQRVRERPGRRIVIRRCQVRVGGQWRDIPEDGGAGRRRLAILDEGDKKLALRVSLDEGGSVLRPVLEPSPKTIVDQIKKSEQAVAKLTHRAASLKNSIAEAQQGLAHVTDEMARIRKQIDLSEKRDVDSYRDRSTDPRSDLVPLIQRETAIKAGLQTWGSELAAVEAENGRSRALLGILTALLGPAQEYSEAPIRVHLGLVIGQEEFNVAEIGPE
jgi:hypothetical protein